MHYFFLEGHSLAGGFEVELAEQDLNHAYRVLRLKPGERVAVADALGKAFSGTVKISEPGKVLVILEEQLPAAESPLNLVLLYSMAKGEKMDLVVRQAVELGIKRIIPLTTLRSIPRLDGQKESKKIKRWQNIARSAAAQCRRAFVPQIEPVRDLRAILPEFSKYRTLVPWEEESIISLGSVLKQPCPDNMAVLLFIGPEGGFESGEIDVIIKAGAQVVSLGPRILRTETAATAAVTMIQAAWGDIEIEGDRQ